MPSIRSISTEGTTIGGSFAAYFEGWMAQKEQLLDELVATRDSSSEFLQNDLRDLINRARAHYEEYFAEKSRMSNTNVFVMFSPNWYTPLERSFLWIAGFKPGLACLLAITAADDLTEEQTERIRQLNHETKSQEKALNDEVAKIQESLAAPPLVEFARSVGRQPQPFQMEIEEFEAMIESLKSSMLNVLNDADRLRTRTAERVMAILSPIQIVRFFAAVAELQLTLRRLGLQREADRAPTAVNNGW